MTYYSEKAEQMFDQEKFGSSINHYVEAFGDMDVHQAAKLQPIIDEFEKTGNFELLGRAMYSHLNEFFMNYCERQVIGEWENE